jgi:Secretion system C-terminal sorting domain
MKPVLFFLLLLTAQSLVAQCNYPIIKKVEIRNTSCSGYDDGSAYIILTDAAVAPLSYEVRDSFTNLLVNRSAGFSSSKAGNFKYIVIDAKGCKDSINFKITQPSRTKLIPQLVQCDNGTGNGKLKLQICYEDKCYLYQWANSDTILSNVKANQPINVLISDGICAQKDTIRLPICLTSNKAEFKNKIKIYPNPAYDKISIEASIDVFKVEIMDISGKILAVSGKNNLTYIPLSMGQQGVLLLKIFTDEGVFIKRFVKL